MNITANLLLSTTEDGEKKKGSSIFKLILILGKQILH